MASDNEPAKLLLPYLQRADELQKHEPLVAYYCRLYAMEKGLRIPQSERTKTTNALLVSLMNQLEKDKKSLKLGPEDNLHVEGFGLNVFEKADKQDRAGRADLNTAKTFYAASIFFEILNQFGALQPDVEQKQKYAVWKAADIRKALKEGRKPVPGPPADNDDELSIPSSTSYDLDPSEASATTPGSGFNPSSQFHDQITSISQSPQFPDGINRQHSAGMPSQFPDGINRQHSAGMPSQFPDGINRQHSAGMPSQFPDGINRQHSAGMPSQFPDGINRQHSAGMPPPNHFDDSSNNQNTTNDVPSPASYPNAGFPGHDFHPPPASGSDGSSYNQAYHHQSYAQVPPQPPLYGYTPQDASPYSLPNFQSYPSFSESSLPSLPSQYPSYHQGSDSVYAPQSPPAPAASHPPTAQRSSSGRNGNVPDHVPSPSETYHYDVNYLPPPEKIVDAHKAAKFAVSALAFDDVPTAVEQLKKSLELLTRPSTGH